MSRWRRAVIWGRTFVDRVYLTLVFLGPKGVIHVGSNIVVGLFFFLKAIHVFNPPTWLNTLGILFLFASVIYSFWLQRKFIARYRRGDTEAPPPP